MSGFPASNGNFLSFTWCHIRSIPQGTPVLGWGFCVAVQSCLDGLPERPESWKFGCTECRIGLLGCGAGMGRSCFSRRGLSCVVQVSRAAQPFPALLGLEGCGKSDLLAHSTEPWVQLHSPDTPDLLALRSPQEQCQIGKRRCKYGRLVKENFLKISRIPQQSKVIAQLLKRWN